MSEADLVNNLTFLDARSIIAAKAFLALFLVIGITAIVTKKIKPWQFLLATGILMAAGYYALVSSWKLPLWGLMGDEITVSAMYNTFAHYGFTDFAFHNLPPFYPPLYFWVMGLAGKLLGLKNGIGIAKLAACFAFAFFPIVFYLIPKYYWKKFSVQTLLAESEEGRAGLEVALLSAPLLAFTFVSVDEVIGKPYEFLSAAAAVYWLTFLYLEMKKDAWSYKKTLVFGLTGGLIFMTYYLWLVFAAISLALLGLTIDREKQWKYFGRYFMSFTTAIIFATPFLVPLIASYARFGTENWQAGFFTLDNVNWTTLFFDKLNWKTLLMLGGFLSLLFNYEKDHIKPLIACLLTAYVWWGIGLGTLLIFNTPMQEFRGFYFFLPIALAIGLSFAIGQVWTYFSGLKQGRKIKTAAAFCGLLLFAQYSVFGSFIDDKILRKRFDEAKKLPERIEKLNGYLQDHKTDGLTLNAVPELMAFAPIDTFIYFNQHNTHPAANFSSRLGYFKDMVRSRTADDFFYKAEHTPYGKITRLILFKDGKNYPFFFHIDKPVAGIEEARIDLPERLINENNFVLAYKFNDFQIWEARK